MDELARFELYKTIVQTMRADDPEPLTAREDRMVALLMTFFAEHLKLVRQVAELERRFTH